MASGVIACGMAVNIRTPPLQDSNCRGHGAPPRLA
jgi:hypothetical protein